MTSPLYVPDYTHRLRHTLTGRRLDSETVSCVIATEYVTPGAQQQSLLGPSDPEEEGTIIFQKVGKFLTVDTM